MIELWTRARRGSVALPLTPLVVSLALFAGCAGGGSSSASGGPPTPLAPPAIAAVTPTAAPVGSLVTITGTEFESSASLSAVFFGDTEAPITSASPAEIVCAVPRGAAQGAAPVSVTTRRGTSPTTAFTVAAGPGGAPALTAISPSIAAPGTTITLTGGGFSPTPSANVITLANEIVVASSATATQLTFVIPAGARAGKVAVSLGPGPASSGRTLFVTSAGAPGSLGTVGDRNRLYLAASPLTHLVVEVDLESGVTPPQAQSGANLVNELRARLHKPGGIAIVTDAPFTSTPPVATWTDAQLTATDLQVRNHYDAPNCATIHYSFVGGQYQVPGVIGLAYNGSSLAVFQAVLTARLRRFARVQVESAVAVHEAGHLLGLVDITSPMVTPHADAGGSHDVSDACVMFATITTDQFEVLTNAPPFVFDAACVQDLQAVGGK